MKPCRQGMVFGQFAASTQFYLFGRKHFTQTGWESARRRYPQPDVLNMLSLHGKVYIVTGANQGIGYEITKYLASRGGQVFMVCRNKARAEAARQAILAETESSSVECLICDCGVEADVRSMWAEFGRRVGKLDALVCNAGALFNEKTLTPQGLVPPRPPRRTPSDVRSLQGRG